MRKQFDSQLKESGYLHQLLPLDKSGSAEARMLKKTVALRRSLTDIAWETSGSGSIEKSKDGWIIKAPVRVEPDSPMDHYSSYGFFKAALVVPGEDWRAYNRVACRVRPNCDGQFSPHLLMLFRNDGETKIPDIYYREGQHVLNLKNHEWNDCVWEMPDMPRDKVTELAFEAGSYGGERMGSEILSFEICDMRLESVENPDVALGWQGATGSISYSTSGYWGKGKKTAVAHGLEGEFKLLNLDGNAVYQGQLAKIENEKGSFALADFTDFLDHGLYRIQIKDVMTKPFSICEHVFEEAAWKALNFVFAERCGYPILGGHLYCHGDLVAEHEGKRIIYNGGWHDAGDLSQQTLQTGEVAQALLELAEAVTDSSLCHRLVEEACWGLDFVLRTRFGDGYRAFSAGACRWTNGFMGDNDDEKVRCHNRSFDNWLLSGVEAYAGLCLAKVQPDLSWICLNAARQDYDFAKARFDAVGMENCVQMEHTYNASLSQYYAVAGWSAALLSKAGFAGYKEDAIDLVAKMLSCQDRGEAGLEFQGFFYRDETKSHIVHFNHQSREHLFAQTLRAMLDAFPEEQERAKWEEGLRSYGSYVKAMYSYSAPYGMLPAGLHHSSEVDDMKTFSLLHVATTYEADRENYKMQLEAGVQLGRGYCIRQFPVWFSFRGNTAVQLSFAKAAAIAANSLNDQELLDIARDQIYWTSGKNPFQQSLMYGEGDNYAQQYAALCGETMGEMPVGIQTRGNEDAPYWPMANNATYKEIWMSSVGHWMRLLAEVF
jgi:hypothetical protein